MKILNNNLKAIEESGKQADKLAAVWLPFYNQIPQAES